MANIADMKWFKENFHVEVEAAIAGTPFTLDLLVALACQETGDVWPILRRKPQLTLDRILALCVGDTIDFKPPSGGRKAFPRNKAQLLTAPRGDEMFALARQALVEMAQFIPGFPVSNPNKFCRGFGMFQLDLQFFKEDPDYFLEKRYEKFSETLGRCIGELTDKARKIGLLKPSLTDMELTAVAIAYNTGNFIPSKGLMQGHFDGHKFYGQHIFDFIRMAHTVPVPGGSPILPPPPPDGAIVPPPTPVEATGPFLVVKTQLSPLRVRSAPKISSPATANVIAQLPDGHPVRAITGTPVKNFIEIETSLAGAHIRGFASADFLVPAPADVTEIPAVPLMMTAPTSGIVEVFMPRRPGLITKRTEVAGAHSLNEPDMPARKGETPDELRSGLNAIIDYLASNKAAHKRYKPRDGLTFCNIYAHDYCLLAGVYLPRVWWTPGAIERLAQGETVQPLIENTITEIRANGLFRWLRDFGPRFGWRQTSTLTKLQQEANMGAVGLIVARRKQDGKSGHIVAVVPETNDAHAARNTAGEVTKPLQSQAGAVNFRRGTGTLNWWKGDQFAESAFWLHA